jgi:pilus assembly protein CpaB
MRFHKKKFFIALLCLAVSAALTWKLFDSVDESKETATVIQASERIEKGTLVTAGMVRRAEIGSYGLDARTIKSEGEILGKYAACDIYPGDSLILENFKEIGEITDNYVIKTREAGKSAVSVQIKGVSAALSGKLKTGDVVSAYVFVSEGGIGSNKGGVVVYPELQCLEIAAVTNSRAEDIDYEPDRPTDNERMKALGDSAIPATVVFITDERQAIRLIEAENTGVIHLVFKGRGEYARKLLDEYETKAGGGFQADTAGPSGGGPLSDATGIADGYPVYANGVSGEEAADGSPADGSQGSDDLFNTGDLFKPD